MKAGLPICAPISALALTGCSRQPKNLGQAERSPSAAGMPAGGISAQPARLSADAPHPMELPLSEIMPHVMQYAGDGEDAFFDAGGKRDDACEECRVQFDPSFEKWAG